MFFHTMPRCLFEALPSCLWRAHSSSRDRQPWNPPGPEGSNGSGASGCRDVVGAFRRPRISCFILSV